MKVLPTFSIDTIVVDPVSPETVVGAAWDEMLLQTVYETEVTISRTDNGNSPV